MVCLDTSFLIDVIRGKKEIVKIEEEIDLKEEIVAIATPTIVELIRGLYLKANIKNIKKEEVEVINKKLSSFTILDLDKDSAVLAGEIEADLINKGEIIDLEDIMIAAIAISNDQNLLTKNKKHFEKIKGLQIETY